MKSMIQFCVKGKWFNALGNGHVWVVQPCGGELEDGARAGDFHKQVKEGRVLPHLRGIKKCELMICPFFCTKRWSMGCTHVVENGNSRAK